MKAILIFNSPQEAIQAGFKVMSPYPDSEGFLHAYVDTEAGIAQALVRTGGQRAK